MRKKQRSQPHARFSHSPPGHTCGLPCCSEDIHIGQGRLNAPQSRYSCMPAPHRPQADLENNFTFRRNKLLCGRPTFTKFYSLQTASGGQRARGALPRFTDDFGIEEGGGREGGKGDPDPQQSAASAARENLRLYRAAIETDTDGSPHPYLDRVALDSGRSVIRTPIRYLQPWECFHNREIILPDLPSTPRKMVFLDYRPEDSHDGEGGEEEEEEETIQVYTSGFNPSLLTPRRSAATAASFSSSLPRAQTSRSSSSSLPTHSSSSFSTHTTSTSTAASSRSSRPKVTYSGGVRPIPAPVIQLPLKSALKKPRPQTATATPTAALSQDTKCPACQSHCHNDSGGCGQDQRVPEEHQQGQGQCPQPHTSHLPGTSTADEDSSLARSAEEDAGLLQQQDSEDLYESHVYDVPSELLEEKHKSKDSNPKPRDTQKPPPVPPTRRNDKPQPEQGRRAITPEMRRRFTSSSKSSGDRTEERYSTFPTRKRHHHYEEVILPSLGKKSPPSPATKEDAAPPPPDTTGLEISRLDIFAAATEKSTMLDGEEETEETEESLYEALSPEFLSDTWNLSRDHSGGSLGSVQSAHLSHGSYASYGCTCLSGDLQRLALADVVDKEGADVVGKGGDVSTGVVVVVGGGVEKRAAGFLADNPITLIL